MNWLLNMDVEYTKVIRGKNNRFFIYYPNHNLTATTEGVYFVLSKKEQKTRILFEDGFGRRLYLTDVDIIKSLVNAPEEIFSIIIAWMKEHEQDKIENKLVLNIESNSFEIPLSFPISTTNTKKELDLIMHNTFKTDADFSINYHDLMILISLIVDKELVVSEDNGTQRKSRQLKKFIVLSEYYRNGKFRGELIKKRYPVDPPIECVYYNAIIAKKIDKIFDDLEF